MARPSASLFVLRLYAKSSETPKSTAIIHTYIYSENRSFGTIICIIIYQIHHPLCRSSNIMREVKKETLVQGSEEGKYQIPLPKWKYQIFHFIKVLPGFTSILPANSLSIYYQHPRSILYTVLNITKRYFELTVNMYPHRICHEEYLYIFISGYPYILMEVYKN